MSDDSIRDYYEQNPGLFDKMIENNGEIDDLRKLDSVLSVSEDIKILKERLHVLEVTSMATWYMLEKKGYTDEEFLAALELAEDKLSDSLKKPEKMICPKCGNLMQVTTTLKTKCIYCGEIMIYNPYAFEQTVVKEGEIIQDVQKDDAYNVENDLNFDDLE